MLTQNKNIKLILNYVVGPVVFCILLYAIYAQIQQQTNWRQSLNQITASLSRSKGSIFLVGALMLLNWGIEARKWQLAMRQQQRISILRAFRAIFSGTTLAFFTPNRMGEYMGRILVIESGKRVSAIGLTLVCSIAQLMITLAAGIGGLVYIKDRSRLILPAGGLWIDLVLYIVSATLIVLTIFYFRLSWLVRWLEKIPRIEKYLTYMRVLDSFNATVLLRILSLSAARYLVFIAQYYVLFAVFSVSVNWWQTFWSMSVVFLVIAIVPSIAVLSELGVRWEASVEVVRLFSANTAGILASSLSVWIINLVVPALIGSLLIAGLKLFRK